MRFNNQPKQNDEEESPISMYYIDPEDWEAVRTGHAAEHLMPACNADLRDGYVVSINYACEVLARQRGGF